MPQENIIQLLLDLLRFDELTVRKADLAQLSPADWGALYDLALKQRVIAFLYHRLKAQSLLDAAPEDIRQSLLNMHRQNAVRNMRLYHEFRQIAGALQAASIPLIVLKGAYLAEAVYQNIALRQMGDMDLLVPKEDLAAASEIVVQMGYQPERPFSLDWDPTFKHLPRFVNPNVGSVELHWNITPRNEPYSIAPAEFWEHSQETRIADIPVRALSFEDVLLVLCEHNSYGHQFNFGLRPYVDIGMAIGFFDGKLDWDAIADRAARWNWSKGVYLTLELARELVGARIPDDVLAKLKPADLDTAIIQEVRQQLFSDKYVAFNITKPIAHTANQGLFGVVRITLQRIFIPKSELANEYLVPPDSKRIYFYYLVRAIHLILRHAKTMWNLHIRKSETDAARRKGRLVAWLEGE